ncbi:hypothetical protein HY489_05200 [Candidatus Woesearchaeota archaeon]|nr:hypothetical protein [Candidatus Woesearchaeota archaeon]
MGTNEVRVVVNDFVGGGHVERVLYWSDEVKKRAVNDAVILPSEVHVDLFQGEQRMQEATIDLLVGGGLKCGVLTANEADSVRGLKEGADFPYTLLRDLYRAIDYSGENEVC